MGKLNVNAWKIFISERTKSPNLVQDFFLYYALAAYWIGFLKLLLEEWDAKYVTFILFIGFINK